MKPDFLISECIRCGTCCKKGGPAFHSQDKYLIEKGIILLKYLYTIRKGEPACDNVKGNIFLVPSDIIKIKSRKNFRACIFFKEKERGCEIYENRPAECRALKCWDTQDIEELYEQNRLTRKDLLSGIEGLWDLIETHQMRCDYETIGYLVKNLNEEKKEEALEELTDMLHYDSRIRSLSAEKGGIDAEITLFLFGHPLTQTLRRFGISVENQGNTFNITLSNI
jgi:Fe-S-cluster containining protein